MRVEYIEHTGSCGHIVETGRGLLTRLGYNTGNLYKFSDLLSYLMCEGHYEPFTVHMISLRLITFDFVYSDCISNRDEFTFSPPYYYPDAPLTWDSFLSRWIAREREAEKADSFYPPLGGDAYENERVKDREFLNASISATFTRATGAVLDPGSDPISSLTTIPSLPDTKPRQLVDWGCRGDLLTWAKYCKRISGDRYGVEFRTFAALVGAALGTYFPIAWPILLRGVK